MVFCVLYDGDCIYLGGFWCQSFDLFVVQTLGCVPKPVT